MTFFGNPGRFGAIPAMLAALAVASPAVGGTQAEEHLAPSVRAGLTRAIADAPVPANYENHSDLRPWLAQMSHQLAGRIPDEAERRALLATVHYEATRAGLDPQLVLSVMYHESGFKKYAVSFAGARGYMQVMPFWVKQLGTPDQNLFHLRTNLRYGMVILRHYLAIENGDLYRALGRYNGSLGRPEYPMAVLTAYHRRFQYVPASVQAIAPTAATFATAAPR